MKVIKVSKAGNYLHHGIGYTDHDGYQGTSDNRWPVRMGIFHEFENHIQNGEQFLVMVNDKLIRDGAIFTKGNSHDLSRLKYYKS